MVSKPTKIILFGLLFLAEPPVPSVGFFHPVLALTLEFLGFRSSLGGLWIAYGGCFFWHFEILYMVISCDFSGIFSMLNPHFCWGEDGDLKDFFGNFHHFQPRTFFGGEDESFSLTVMVVSTKSGEDFTFFFSCFFAWLFRQIGGGWIWCCRTLVFVEFSYFWEALREGNTLYLEVQDT